VPLPPVVKKTLPDRWGRMRPHIPELQPEQQSHQTKVRERHPPEKPKPIDKPNGHVVTVSRLKNNPPKMLTIMELKPRHCRWIIGDPRDESSRYCGAHKERGAYCHEHAALCYVEPNNRNGAIRAQEAVAKWAGPKRKF